MDKEAICKAFAKRAHSYSDHAWAQRASASHLMERVRYYCSHIDSIVDIGSGTGTLLPYIRAYYPHALLYCNDIAPAMLATIERDVYNVEACICGDAEYISLPHATLYISNFAFQWFQSLYDTITKLLAHCSILAFTTLLEGTFREWNALCEEYGHIPATYRYPSYVELKMRLMSMEYALCDITEQYYPITFPNPRAFMRYLQRLGANIPSTKQFQNYRAIYTIENPFTTWYHVACVVIRK